MIFLRTYLHTMMLFCTVAHCLAHGIGLDAQSVSQSVRERQKRRALLLFPSQRDLTLESSFVLCTKKKHRPEPISSSHAQCSNDKAVCASFRKPILCHTRYSVHKYHLSPIPSRNALLRHFQEELRVDGGLDLHPAEGLLVLGLLAGHGVGDGLLELLVGRHHHALLLGVAGLVLLDGLVVVLWVSL